MSKKIVIATILWPTGETGVQTHFRAFSSWLSKNNVLVVTVTPFWFPKWISYPVFAFRRVIDFISSAASVWWYRYWHYVFLRNSLQSFLSSGERCVIYAQCPVSAKAALEARYSASQAVVMVVHFNISQADEWCERGAISKNGYMYKAIRNFEDDVLPRLDGIVFVSDFMRKELSARIRNLSAVPYCVSPNFLETQADIDAVVSLSSDMICIGTLEPRKNQKYALEIVAAARRHGYPLTLTLVGDGPDRRELESKARLLSIESNVRFAGYIHNAVGLMTRHRVCLHVARIENMPLVLIEALSQGMPVFAPKVGGIPEIFDDGCEGFYIPLDNADAAAKIIIKLLQSPEIFLNISQSASRRYQEQFATESLASKLHEFLLRTGH